MTKEQTQSFDDSISPEEKARQIALRAWSSGHGADPSSQDELISRYPELEELLRDQFRRLRLIDFAQQLPEVSRETSHDKGQSSNAELDTRSVELKTGSVEIDSYSGFNQTLSVENADTISRDGAQTHIEFLRCPRCSQLVDPASQKIEVGADSIICDRCGEKFTTQVTVSRLTPGLVIGDYQLRRILGSGAFGQVWLAYDENLNREVALKIPRKGSVGDHQADSFLREARIAASVRHPGVVAVHDVGRVDGVIYICSEFIQGNTLDQWLDTHEGALDDRVALVLELCDPLQAIHDAGVIHRDLKPSNVLVDPSGKPRITDFGVAKADHNLTVATATGQVLGTYAYMAPEVAIGQAKEADARTDVYSLGVMLYEMLTGQLPFGTDMASLPHRIVNERPAPIVAKDSDWDISADLRNICMKCLEKDPRDRYPSAVDLGADLRRYRQGLTVSAKPKSPILALKRTVEQYPYTAALVAISLVSFLLVPLLWSQLQDSQATQDQQQDQLRETEEQLSQAEDQIDETKTKTQATVEEAAFEKQIAEVRTLGASQPHDGLTTALQLTEQMTEEDDSLSLDSNLQRRVMWSQVLVDLSTQIDARVRLFAGGGRTQLGELSNGSFYSLTYQDIQGKKSRHNRRLDQVSAKLFCWQPSPSGGEENGSVRIEFSDLHEDQVIQIGNSHMLRFLKASRMIVPKASGGQEGQAAKLRGTAGQQWSYELKSLAIKEGERTRSWYWQDIRALSCHLAEKDKFVLIHTIDGRIKVVRFDDLPTDSGKLQVQSLVDLHCKKIQWIDSSQILLAETEEGVKVWRLEMMESAIDVKPLGFIPGSLLATDARSDLAIIRKPDDSQLGFYEFLEQGDGPDVIQCRCEVLSSNLKEVKRHPSRDVVYLLERSEEASTWYWVDLALGEKKQLVRSKPTRRKLQVVPHPNFPVVALVQDSIDLFDLESQEFARREVEKTNPTAMLGQLQWIEGSMDFAISIYDRVILVEDTERSAAMNSKRGGVSSGNSELYAHHKTILSFVLQEEDGSIAISDVDGEVFFKRFEESSFSDLLTVNQSQVHDDRIKDLVHDEDRRKMVCLWESGKLQFFGERRGDRQTNRISLENWVLESSQDQISRCLVSGDYAVSVTESGYCRSRQLRDPQQEVDLPVQVADQSKIRLSQDGHWVAVFDNFGVQWCDLFNPTKKFPRVDFANGILTAGFAHLQDLIWVIERDGTIKLLEPSSGQVVRSLPDKVEPADYRAIAAKDYVLGVAQDSITVFSTRRFQSSPQEYQGDAITDAEVNQTDFAWNGLQGRSINISRDDQGDSFLLIPTQKYMQVFEIGSGRWSHQRLWEGNQYLRAFEAWGDSQSKPIMRHSSQSRRIALGRDAEVLVWKLGPPGELMRSQDPVELRGQPRDEVTDMRFSADGNILAVGYVSGRVNIWFADANETNSQPLTINWATEAIDKLAFVGDTSVLLVSSGSKLIQIPLDLPDLGRTIRNVFNLETRGSVRQARKRNPNLLQGAALPN